MTKQPVNPKQLRSFGLIVGGVFILIGLWPMVVHDYVPRWWVLAIAGLFILPAFVVPLVLTPVYRVWMLIGHMLGWVNTRIILAIGFYGVMTPLGLLMRLMGKDPMHLVNSLDAKTYRVTRTSRSHLHMRHQF